MKVNLKDIDKNQPKEKGKSNSNKKPKIVQKPQQTKQNHLEILLDNGIQKKKNNSQKECAEDIVEDNMTSNNVRSISQSNPTLDALLSSPISAKWSPAMRGSFVQEIQLMMHGFGDYHKPMAESAQVVEDIVHEQMAVIMMMAADVAQDRGNRFIGLEEILFLMRKDKMKLARLIKHLKVKDACQMTARVSSMEEEDLIGNASDVLAKDGEEIVINGERIELRKRVRQCYEFIKLIDSSGSLLDVFDDQFFDCVKHERNVRLDKLAMNISETQYVKFCESRKASFANKAKTAKFKEWIMKDCPLEIRPNNDALEILQYLAYETVAQIVDLALIVKHEMERDMCDPMSVFMPNNTLVSNPDYPMYQEVPLNNNPIINNITPNKQTVNNEEMILSNGLFLSPQVKANTLQKVNPTLDSLKSNKKRNKSDINSSRPIHLPHSFSITPHHIIEAFRRFNTPSGPFANLYKLKSPQTNKLFSI